MADNDKNLRIIYMGTPEFAVPILEALVENGWPVVAVITAPDRPKGRGKKPGQSPVKEAALRLNIPVLQPINLKSPEFIDTLKTYGADLQVVVAFRMLPKVVWNMPALGTINLHASLLPDYRGAAPINWAIINGEQETGLSTFFLQQEIDTGKIIFQEKIAILPEDTAGSLSEKMMHRGAALVLETLESIASGNVQGQEQDDTKAKHTAPKIFKETGKIDWKKPANTIHNLVRGLSPYPAAWTEINGKTCKIYLTELISGSLPDKAPGEYQTDGKNHLYFQTGDGLLSIIELQMEGKKRMRIAEFLRGNKLDR